MRKLFSKTVAALLSITCMSSIMTTSFNGTPLFTPKLIADAEESSCVSFDEETGTLTLSGQVESNCLYSYRNSKKVKRVEASEGTVLPEDSTRLFTYILADTIDLSKADSSKVKYASLMFDHCKNIKFLDLRSFNTSNVISMTSMFIACSSLESIDLSSFNTSNVDHMGYMFNGCSNLKFLDLSNFNTKNVLSMTGMFIGCSSLEELDLSSFDTTNVQGMGRMFTNCSNLKSVNLSSFDTSKVTNMGYMFYYCSSVEALNLNNFDTSNVTGMEYMFSNCSSLKSLDLSSFDTSNVKNMDHMFTSCSRLGELNLSSFNTSKIDNMRGMFQLCESLKSLNLSSFDTKNVKSMQNMFSECTSLKSIFVSDKWSTDSVVISDNMFYNCSNLKGISTVFDPAYIDHKRACIDTFLTQGYLRSSKANINDGIYIIESAVAPNMMADVDLNEANGESNLRLLNRNDSSAQKFSITSTGNGNYTIRLANNKDKALTAKGNTAGSNVVASQYNAKDRQIWHFEYADDGYYYIRSKTGYYLDVSGGFSQNNTNIQLYVENGSDAERWKLIKIKDAENPSDNDDSNQNNNTPSDNNNAQSNTNPTNDNTTNTDEVKYVKPTSNINEDISLCNQTNSLKGTEIKSKGQTVICNLNSNNTFLFKFIPYESDLYKIYPVNRNYHINIEIYQEDNNEYKIVESNTFGKHFYFLDKKTTYYARIYFTEPYSNDFIPSHISINIINYIIKEIDDSKLDDSQFPYQISPEDKDKDNDYLIKKYVHKAKIKFNNNEKTLYKLKPLRDSFYLFGVSNYIESTTICVFKMNGKSLIEIEQTKEKDKEDNEEKNAYNYLLEGNSEYIIVVLTNSDSDDKNEFYCRQNNWVYVDYGATVRVPSVPINLPNTIDYNSVPEDFKYKNYTYITDKGLYELLKYDEKKYYGNDEYEESDFMEKMNMGDGTKTDSDVLYNNCERWYATLYKAQNKLTKSFNNAIQTIGTGTSIVSIFPLGEVALIVSGVGEVCAIYSLCLELQKNNFIDAMYYGKGNFVIIDSPIFKPETNMKDEADYMSGEQRKNETNGYYDYSRVYVPWKKHKNYINKFCNGIKCEIDKIELHELYQQENGDLVLK